MFKDELHYKPFEDRYKLTQRLTYKASNGTIHIIPQGFITDLTTYYIEGKWTRASVLHDYLLSISMDRDLADMQMREAMRSLKVDGFNYHVISVGLRIGNLWGLI